jgi:hypothetical protein
MNSESVRLPQRKTIMSKTLTLLTIVIVVLVLFAPAHQSAAPTGSDTVYQFVEVETTVHLANVETSSEHPEERRWYMSTVIVQPEDVPTYSLIQKKFIPYFNANVMDPAEKRGIAIDYDDQGVKLNGDVSYANYATRQEATEQRNKEIEYRKGQGGNIYEFTIDFNSPKGEATSKPKLIYRDKEQPNYEK